MEAFETFVALALEEEEEEEEDFIVSPAVKFPLRRQVRKASRVEFQEHGYEVDLVAGRADRLVLATVKSFLGSHGVAAEAVIGETCDERRRGMYRLLNDPEIRNGVLKAASKRYGYRQKQIELRLYVGRFAGRHGGGHRRRIESGRRPNESERDQSRWSSRGGRRESEGRRDKKAVPRQPGAGCGEGFGRGRPARRPGAGGWLTRRKRDPEADGA